MKDEWPSMGQGEGVAFLADGVGYWRNLRQERALRIRGTERMDPAARVGSEERDSDTSEAAQGGGA